MEGSSANRYIRRLSFVNCQCLSKFFEQSHTGSSVINKNDMIFNMIPVIFLAFLHTTTRAEVAKGACHCAVFEVSGKEPLIEHALPFDVPCDEDGAEKCSQLCLALAQSAKEKAPAMICEKLNRHIENLKVAVHTKSCGADAWRFTGLESSKAICCHEGKETACNISVTAI